MADSILYWLEHFSAMRRSYTDIDCPSTWDTVYSDTIRFYFKILEHTSTGDFWIMDHDCAGGPFPRYSSQADSSILRDVWIGNNQLKESWHYAADTGLRTYSYSYWSAHRNEGYGFSLDSLHLVMHE